MLIEDARRAEAAVKKMLAIADDGSATTDELREALAISKSIVGVAAAFQASAAAAVAGRERHGDGGAEVLATAAGLSRQEARSQVKTAQAIQDMPRLRDAVAEGRVSQANAKRLAEAVDRTSATDVEADCELLANAESMRPEQFTKEARRWTVDREGDGGVSEHARQRARRRVRIWNGDDGMVHLRGEFDSVTGQRIGNRLRAEAARLHDTDKKHASTNGDGRQRRSFDQCMADALDQLTGTAPGGASGKPFADICVVAHVDEATGKLIAELPDDVRLPQSVLEELACNARLTGVIYDRRGRPIWRAHSVRRATKAQRQMLVARDGGCFACGAHPDICDAHHVRPVSQGGATSLDNMVLACWRCHNKIHHFGWQIHGPPGNRTLHPPDTATHGPAHAPERLSLFHPGTPAAPAQPQMLETAAAHSPSSRAGSMPAVACAPAHQQVKGSRRDGARQAQPGDPPTRPGPAAARAALAGSRARRAGTPTRPAAPTAN